MRGNNGPTSIDHGLPICFEGIGGVVELDPKEDTQEVIREAIDPQLDRRVIDDAAALDEAAAEDAVPAFVELLPVANDVAAVVRFVGHHDDSGVAPHFLQAPIDGASEARLTQILNGAQDRE